MTNKLRALTDRLRFRHKLLLSYLVISLIPILILGFYSYTQSRTYLNRQAMQGIQENADVYAESIQTNMDRYETMASLILYNSLIQRILSNQYDDLLNLYNDLNQFLNPYFNMLLNLNKETEQLTIYTKKTIPEYGSYINHIERISDESWYLKLDEVKGVKWFSDSGRMFLAGKFPQLYTRNNTGSSSLTTSEENILYIRMNNKAIFSNEPGAVQNQTIYVLDSQNRPVYSNRPDDPDAAGELARIRMDDKGIAQFNGNAMFLIKRNIPHTDWTLYYAVPYRNVVSNAGSIIRATLIIAGICLLIMIAIISVFTRTMIRRIFMLNKLMRRVENGELGLQVNSASKDEIGELTNRFGNMLGRINELISQVYRNQISQKEAELKALKSQFTPHFLYNTLSFINWKALRSEQHEISQMVTSLSRFYRTALNRGDNVITIRDEIDNIKSYLEIALTTSGHRFNVAYQIDEEVYAYGMINLILQPVVENAVKHGINRITDEQGYLEISARVKDDKIEFDIFDNGPGIGDLQIEDLLSKPTSGYGLKNVDERIKLFFGTEFGISVAGARHHGTCMRITIPRYKLPD